MNSFVIGISGVSGSGKTTLTQKLSEGLNATKLFWDEFDEVSNSPDDYVEWYNSGRNYDAFDYISLSQTLLELKVGKSIKHPVTGQMLNPSKYIIFDAPLGRLHEQTGKYINFCIHIDTPLDISLVRRTLRDFTDSNKTKEELLEDLNFYMNSSRPLFCDKLLIKLADLVIDGLLTPEEQVKKIISNINNN
ncbi:AAA family ATPase [Fluviispira multicolorata]|uniref:AAA family ATPase n=1 Tax=Fluviispira multicolorata TaxID=2654512 RepID=A0A833N6Y8_9BACT|nr:AAA family ATPase [Fluviispira multicolorata]KAB8031028.1 AAA family ATPase [Fluviispira multicolorata]